MTHTHKKKISREIIGNAKQGNISSFYCLYFVVMVLNLDYYFIIFKKIKPIFSLFLTHGLKRITFRIEIGGLGENGDSIQG